MIHGYNPTSIETLGERLKVDYQVYQSSSKKNMIIRILDMWLSIITNQNRIQVVLIDTYGSSAFHYAWTSGMLCKFLQKPYFPILRGGELPLRVQKNKLFSKWFARNAQMLIAPSGYLAQTFQPFSKNIKVIPNFIDLVKYPFLNREILDDLNILWVRSFHKSYQPHLAIEIVQLIKAKNIRIKVTMVGPDKDGSLAECQNLAKKLDVSDQIHFTGRLSKKDWIALSAKHNVFLNTTSVDNTPVSVMEAMALGMPVVTTKVGGIPFLFEDDKEGIMVEEPSAEALADAILELRESPEKIKYISQHARRKAESWDWLVVRNQWNEILMSN